MVIGSGLQEKEERPRKNPPDIGAQNAAKSSDFWPPRRAASLLQIEIIASELFGRKICNTLNLIEQREGERGRWP